MPRRVHAQLAAFQHIAVGFLRWGAVFRRGPPQQNLDALDQRDGYRSQDIAVVVNKSARSVKIKDRRRLSMGRAGDLSIGSIIFLVLTGWALGINPLYLIGGAEMLAHSRQAREIVEQTRGQGQNKASRKNKRGAVEEASLSQTQDGQVRKWKA